jgi:hypothetical protein
MMDINDSQVIIIWDLLINLLVFLQTNIGDSRSVVNFATWIKVSTSISFSELNDLNIYLLQRRNNMIGQLIFLT